MATEDIEWVPGENCDVILQHYKHEPIPLVCHRIQSDPIGPRVRIHFETYWPANVLPSRDNADKATKVRHLWFTVLTSDEVLCPDGGWYPFSPYEIRRRLNNILQETTDINLYTQAGIISGLYCDEHAIINTIYQDAQTLEINLTTRELKDIPIGPEQENTWLPLGTLRPYSTWGAAVWQ